MDKHILEGMESTHHAVCLRVGLLDVFGLLDGILSDDLNPVDI